MATDDGSGVLDYFALVGVWLLVSVAVGPAGSATLDALGTIPQPGPLETPLVVGGVSVALAELFGRRPTVPEAAGFAALARLLALFVVLPLGVVGAGAVVLALSNLVTVGVAGWVVFGAGMAQLVETARSVLGRLTNRPPAGR